MTAAENLHTMAADDLQPSPDAARMADALRSGVALRRQQEAASPGGDAARFSALGDLDSLGAVAKPGAAAPLIKFGRRLLLVFLRPWLAMQTIFNRELARRFDEQATAVRDLRRRVPLVEESMQALDSRLRAVERARPATVAADAAADLTSVCRLFVHSRLPPPPATVKILPGIDEALAGDLHALGYQLQSSSSDDHADVLIAPFDDRGVDWRAVADARLPAGCRLLAIAAANATRGKANAALTTDAAAHGWRVEEWLVAANDSWSVMVTPDASQNVIGTVMVRQRQSDAPAR
jgi:hypothetical protein